MGVTSISRLLLDRSLRTARLPLDTAMRIAGRDRVGVVGAAAERLDRMDAAIRDLAGSTLGDHRLRDEAERRRRAARV
jgi:hypothetical protein